MTPKEKLKEIAVEQSPWLRKARWRQRNEWWLKHWAYIQVKYYRLKRKLGLRK
jgi:hypothetical protein